MFTIRPKNALTPVAVNAVNATFVQASRSPRRGERQQFLGGAGLSDAVAKGPAALGGGGDGAEARADGADGPTGWMGYSDLMGSLVI